MIPPDPIRAVHPLHDVLQHAFAALIETGEIDIATAPDTAGDEIEVQADDWTLHLEGWPVVMAWIAIDHEPDPAEHRAALEATLDHRELAAMRDADGSLEGALVACLRASGDELSARLADLLAEPGPAPASQASFG